jgi:signal transduction histidine kinase
MEADVAQMEALVTGILELERLRDGRGVHLERGDLIPLVHQVAAPFREGFPGVRVSAPSEPVELDLDAERVRMLLRNALDNAAKYSLPDSRPVEIAVVPLGQVVEVRIRDDGPGIAEADLANVFEPFFRADRSRSRKTGGYGLGLSMCRRIVEAHGGRIVAENNPGRGLSIVVSLPR